MPRIARGASEKSIKRGVPRVTRRGWGMGRRSYVPAESALPTNESGNGTWKGQFGEAVVRQGVPPPERRSLQADMWWLLDNVLKLDECMDINRSHYMVRTQIARYIRERNVPRGTIKVRPLDKGKCRVWKLSTGYEKPD